MSDAAVLIERFHAKVIETDDGCWCWQGALTYNGYGQFWDGTKTVRAHRWSYQHYVGAIPEGLTIDHLCKNPACVKPTHLEAVTIRENVLRGTGPSAINAAKNRCDNGHEFNQENTYIRPDGGGRCCRTCWGERTKSYGSRRAEKVPCPDCGSAVTRSNIAKHRKRCEA